MKYIKLFEDQKIEFNQNQIDEVIQYLDSEYHFSVSHIYSKDTMINIDGVNYNVSDHKTLVRRKILLELEEVFDYDTSVLNKAIKLFLNQKIEHFSKLKYDDIETLKDKIVKYLKILKYDLKVKKQKDITVYIAYEIKIENRLKIALSYRDDYEIPVITILYQKGDGYYVVNLANYDELINYLFKHKIIDSKNIFLKFNT
jgi:hypothetical protein